MAGVKYLWTSMGVLPDVSQWSTYTRVMRGLRRQKGGVPNRKHPISPADLMFFRSRMDLTAPFAAAVWACMLTTWWGMLRKSNTTVGNSNLLDTGSCICLCDIEFDDVAYTVTLNVRKSKTNQFRDRVHRLVLQGLAGHQIDPVQALQNHLMLNTPAASDALFVFREGAQRQQYQMTHNMLVTVTKILFQCQGGDPAKVGGHSYRRGTATTSFRAGVPDALMQQHGDWAGLTYRIYADLSQACRAKLTAAVFAAITQPDGINSISAGMVAADSPWGHLNCGEEPGPLGTQAEAASHAQSDSLTRTRALRADKRGRSPAA